jgi:6-phosphofructokinase 1
MALKKVAVLTSGGDSPGMNAAIRAVVRVGRDRGVQVMGVQRGYVGLIANHTMELDARVVGGIIQRGGTVLGTARSRRFMQPEVRKSVVDQLRRCGIEGLVVIGGNGSLSGALALHEIGFPVIGVPATIDNDIFGTDTAIGVDTATNTALEALDRIKDTASSHNRAFVVEVMGRESGYLALMSGIAAGAEMVVVPEVNIGIDDVIRELKEAYARGKPHFIVVVAEGATLKARDLAEGIKQSCSIDGEVFESRLTVLGHVMRGGSPSAADRILATQLGTHAAELICAGESGKMVALDCGKITSIDISTALSQRKQLPEKLYSLSGLLSK